MLTARLALKLLFTLLIMAMAYGYVDEKDFDLDILGVILFVVFLIWL